MIDDETAHSATVLTSSEMRWVTDDALTMVRGWTELSDHVDYLARYYRAHNVRVVVWFTN